MLQRKVMFKQLQELQRRQQLQDVGDTRNQNFGNPLSSLKHASAGQFSATVNGGTPILDSSQMLLYGNIESPPVGLSLPQLDISSYGTHAPNDSNFDQYSHLQGSSNLSMDLRTKNYNNLGGATMQPSPFGSSFMNQQPNFPSERIHMADGQVPIEGYNRESLSGNYSQQGIPMKGNVSLLESEGGQQDANWDGTSPGKSSTFSLSGTPASLDPLEQKILYGTDDNIWDSSLNESGKMGTGGFQTLVEQTSHMDSLPSLQSGSWSALMQSAVAETSSSDTGMQEQWSGATLKNPEALNGNQLPNVIESQQLQNNWVDRNLQNDPPLNPVPERLFQNLNVNHSFSNFQESRHQYGSSLATPGHFPDNSGHLIVYSSPQKLPTKGTEMIQMPPSSTKSPDPGFRLQTADPQTPLGYSFFPTLVGGSSGTTYLRSNGLNDTDNQLPALPISRSVGTEVLEGALQNSEPKTIQSGGQQFPLLENNPIIQTSLSSDMLQKRVVPTSWPHVAAQQDAPARKPFDFSKLFGFPNHTSSSLEATKHLNQLEGYGQQLKQGTSLPESLSEMNNSTSHGSTNMPQNKENFQLEAGAVESGSVMTNTHQHPSNQAEGDEVPPVPHGDIGDSGNILNQSYSGMHHMHSSRNIDTDGGRTKYDNVNSQKSNASAIETFMSCQKFGADDMVKNEPRVISQVGAFWSRDRKGLNLSQENQVDELVRVSPTAHLQKQMDMLGESNAIIRSVGSVEASNLMHPAQNSQQTAPSWVKHCETVKTGTTLPICEPNVAGSALQQFSELQQNNLTMQVNSAQANPGGIYPPTTVTSILGMQLGSPFMLASDMNSQNLAVSVPKKRKLTEFTMVPWHKEMTHEPSRPLDISIVEQEWAQALSRTVMEVKGEVNIFEDYLPKRRLICTTQLMQQIFGSIPSVVVRSNASSNYDIMPYSAARLMLGDACNLSSQLLNDTNEISPEKLKTLKKQKAYEFSKIAEAFDGQAKNFQAQLEKFSKSLSYASMRVEAQELDKFSMINRFARIHIKALQPSTADPAASSSAAPSLPRNSIQRYVVALPMPSIVPEEADCLSL